MRTITKIGAIVLALVLIVTGAVLLLPSEGVDAETDTSADYTFNWNDGMISFYWSYPEVTSLSPNKTVMIHLPADLTVSEVIFMITDGNTVLDPVVDSFRYSIENHTIYGVFDPAKLVNPPVDLRLKIDLIGTSDSGVRVVKSTQMQVCLYEWMSPPTAPYDSLYEFSICSGQFVNFTVSYSAGWTLVSPDPIPDWLMWNSSSQTYYQGYPPGSVDLVLKSPSDEIITMRYTMIEEVELFDPYGEIANPPSDDPDDSNPGDSDPHWNLPTVKEIIGIVAVLFVIICIVAVVVTVLKRRK